jgi:hypothetical protein
MTSIAPILQPPTPSITTSSDNLYKFLLEIWNRTGGYNSSSQDLKGLKSTITELNTLVGVNTDDTVQEQLNSKATIASLGNMAFQNSNNVNIVGGSLSDITVVRCSASNFNATTGTLNSFTLNQCTEDGCTYNTVTINSGTISGPSVYVKTGSVNRAQASGSLYTDVVTVANAGAVETTLITYPLLANTLDVNKDYIEIMGFGTFAANANNKEIKFKLGVTTLYDTGVLALNGGSWQIKAVIIRTGVATQKCIVEVSSSNLLLPNSAVYSSTADNLAADLNVYFTGTGIANNDIVQEGMTIKYFKG